MVELMPKLILKMIFLLIWKSYREKGQKQIFHLLTHSQMTTIAVTGKAEARSLTCGQQRPKHLGHLCCSGALTER